MVTGGAGFIGSSLVRELVKEKANVIVYDNFSSGDKSNLLEVKSSVEIIEGDILDPSFQNVLHDYEVEYLFHLAAEPYIPKCYYSPQKILEVNTLGTLKVLLACKNAEIKRILYYSTSEVYGSAVYSPMNEQHPTNPQSTYAVSKLAADKLCYTMHHEHGVPVIILRQFNTYGPRETQPYVIPEIITQLSKNHIVELGNIKAKRDFTYVEDAVKGAIALIKYKKAEGEVINLGSNHTHSIEEITQTIAELGGWNPFKVIIEPKRFRPLDVEILHSDYSKAQRLMGWKPETNLKEGLMRTIEWFKEHGCKWIWEDKIASEKELWA